MKVKIVDRVSAREEATLYVKLDEGENSSAKMNLYFSLDGETWHRVLHMDSGGQCYADNVSPSLKGFGIKTNSVGDLSVL